MKIDVLTLFPEMFDALKSSIIGKAQINGLLAINTYQIRDYSADKHKKCDDYAFGGGAGMLMTPQPLYDAIQAADPDHSALRIYLSPKGRVLNQKTVTKLAKLDHILLLCGHYEGIDQRIIDHHIDMELSIGDYVLTGGELPAMVLIDSVSRYIEGVLGSGESTAEESFSQSLLEYPQYTRPAVFMDIPVPEVLLSGHHENVAKWRKEQSLLITQKNRPDLLKPQR